MYNYLIVLAGFILLSMTIISHDGVAQNPITVGFKVTGDNLDTGVFDGDRKIIIGLDNTAIDGKDDKDKALPGIIFLTPQKGNVLFLIPNENDLFLEDFRPFNPFTSPRIWTIKINFGESTGNRDITLNWENADTSNPFQTSRYFKTELIDGDEIINLKSKTSHKFMPASQSTRNVLIKLENAPTIAADDAVFGLKSNESLTISPLSNDTDLDVQSGAILTIDNGLISQTDHASLLLTENQTQIVYTPNSDHPGDDEFNYTVTDGISSATAKIKVYIDNMSFTRSHSTVMSPGSGLAVTLTIHYVTDFPGQSLRVTEFFDDFDISASGFYQIANGNGPGGKNISGTHLPEVTIDGKLVTFFWNSLLPSSPITLTYVLIGNNSDCNVKTIFGQIHHGNLIGDSVTNTFQPLKYHPSDKSHDSAIDLFDFLDYVGPIADAFQLGVPSGSYCYDGSKLYPKTFNPCSGSQVLHDADSDHDGKISIFEYLDYAGPVADVFQLGVSGHYIYKCTTLTPSVE